MASPHEALGPDSLANPSFTLADGAVALWMTIPTQKAIWLEKAPYSLFV